MAFNSYSFTYRGTSSYEYGLMICDFGNANQGDGSFSSPIKLVEDRLNRRHSSLYYGATQNTPLQFNLVFAVDTDNINTPLSRYDLQLIGEWLTGTNGYEWLQIEQPDLEMVRFKCIFSDLKIINVGWHPYCIQATVTCDSPFAYLLPEEYTFTTNTTSTNYILNKSSLSGYYYPKLEITLPSGVTTISIKNVTDGNYEFKIIDLPNSTGQTITVDNENQIITSSAGLNVYQYFNFNFFKLHKGDNQILISGNSTVKFICEFPVNVGG